MMATNRRSRRAPRHDADAGGDQALLADKAALREEVWSALTEARVGRFPGAYGRIPNFVGAEAAARRLASTEVWAASGTLKANPDAPQWPVRQRALEDGKLVYMAVPRLASDRPFLALDPHRLSDSPRSASSIKGASRSAHPVDLADLTPVDLVVAGCVAVGEDGARLGKGGGFSDLELAIAEAAGLIGPHTRLVTTVHELQILPAGRIPTTDHDRWVDLIVTPDRLIALAPRPPARTGIRWDELTDEKVAAIPILGRLERADATGRPSR